MVSSNRAELEFYFDSILGNNYEDITTSNRFSYGSNAVKTYIIESHNFKKSTSRDDIISSLMNKIYEFDAEAKVSDTEEESLVHLITKKCEFYLDIGYQRYLIFHTANPTKFSDPFIKKIHNTLGFDSLWLPVPLLLDTTDIGRFWGLGVNYRDYIEETGEEELLNPDDVQDLSLDIKRHFAKRFFNLLMASEMKHMMGISKISIIKSSNEERNNLGKFIIDDIKYNGKLTAKGNSFSKHSRVVYDLLGKYNHSLNTIEDYGLSFDEGFLSGNPITITFSKDINVKKLVDLLFNASEPFKLWGIEDEIGKDQFRVYAVDLHNGNSGNKLSFEITSKYLRISLPKYSCGNTIMRLMANLNHHVDAMAKLEVVDYELDANISRTGLS